PLFSEGAGFGVLAPVVNPDEPPNPRVEMLPTSGGGVVSSGGTGAYSRTVDGFDWGMLSELGRTRTVMKIAMARLTNGG
ncbi:MAG: hypothetical protein LC723_14950, partial [Actinobacteria bacterium]|nr:hypothetical protein [Actinomycetota bacterium]